MAKDNVLKIAELRSKTSDELNDLLTASKKEAFNLRFQLKNGELDKTNRIREVRTNVAKISTVISEQRLGLTVVKKEAPKKAAKKTEAKKETTKKTATKAKKEDK